MGAYLCHTSGNCAFECALHCGSAGYNLCYGLCGGLSPLAATWLVERTGDEIAPAFLIMTSAAVTFVTLFFLRESYRIPFGAALRKAAPRTAAA